MNTNIIGTAELLLITDCTVGDEHFAHILKLAGKGIEKSQINVVDSGRTCSWPLILNMPSGTSIRDVSSHLWHLANYLVRERETVQAMLDLGCNLQLNLYGVTLDPRLSLSSSTLKQLGDLNIQLELIP